VTNAQAQAQVGITQSLADIAKAVVPTVTAAHFQARHAGLEVQLIVGHEDGAGLDFEKFRHRGYRLATAVHKRGGDQQADVHASGLQASAQTVKFGLRLQPDRVLSRQFNDKICPRIVAGPPVFITGVPETNNQPDPFWSL
jgi:hypothetical protein